MSVLEFSPINRHYALRDPPPNQLRGEQAGYVLFSDLVRTCAWGSCFFKKDLCMSVCLYALCFCFRATVLKSGYFSCVCRCAYLSFAPKDGVNLRQNYIDMMTAVSEQLEVFISLCVCVCMCVCVHAYIKCLFMSLSFYITLRCFLFWGGIVFKMQSLSNLISKTKSD